MENVVKGVLQGINYQDPVVRYRGQKVEKLAILLSGRKQTHISSSLGIDLFYTFYLPAAVLSENIPEELREQWTIIKNVLNSSKYGEVKSKTMLDSFISSIAASIIASEVLKAIEETSRRTGTPKGEGEQSIDLKETVEKALESTSKLLDNVKTLKRLAEGDQPGSSSLYELEEYSIDLIKLARNIEINKILDLIRGFKPWIISTPEEKSAHRHGEYDSYELGRDVERIVASNLALPEELFFLRLAEGRLLLYRKVLSKGRGPVYVLLDKSGSMDGIKITWAKAVAIAAFLKASHEHRDFYLRFFDSITYPLVSIESKIRARKVIDMIDYIASVKGSGGTDISRAIITATVDLRTKKAPGVSDIILITDGIDRIAEQQVLFSLKKANARLITVMIGGDNKSLMKISHKYLRVEKLSSREIIKVINTIKKH
ncbi:vWA domain-containing protein [Thermogladius sp. 4427co]|uniref:vWA domain-containing protein n=1 Tax=Thermogladius sp. 4427co TaxID=3450718 RepID=UPI003F79FA5F